MKRLTRFHSSHETVVHSRLKPILLFLLVITILAPDTTAQESAPAAAPETINLQVVDDKGQPIEGVTAFWYHNGKSKKLTGDGSQFKDVPIQGLIVANKDGYQHSGLILKQGANQLTLRVNGQPGPTRKTLPSPLTSEIRKQVLSDIQQRLADNLADNPNDPRILSIQLPLLARIAPVKAEQFIENNKLPPMMLPMVQKGMVEGLAKTDFEAAAEIIDGIERPEFRSMTLNVLLQTLPPESENLETIETQFMDSIQSVKQPGLKLAQLAALAEHFLATNRPEKAKQIAETYLSLIHI